MVFYMIVNEIDINVLNYCKNITEIWDTDPAALPAVSRRPFNVGLTLVLFTSGLP